MRTSSRWLHIPANEYLDRMKAGWVGQMVGVGWAQIAIEEH
ncbi:MAG: hypothetical protein ACUVTY_01110 [Armatimonadota bacterium]